MATKSDKSDGTVAAQDPADDAIEFAPFGDLFETDLDIDWDSFGEFAAAEPDPAGEVELALSDLISDDNNEVVLTSDPSFETLKLTVDSEVLSSGIAADHVTAGGQDVTGYHYLSFESGLTLYYGDGIDLQIHSTDI